MTLSRNLALAEEQLDAMVASDIPFGVSDAVGLRDFLRQCRVEAEALEDTAPTPLILGLAGELARG